MTDHDRNDEHQPARGALLILELAAVLDGVAGGSLTFAFDSILHLSDEAAEIASAHVGHDDDAALAFFAIDDLGRAGHAYIGDLVEGDLFAVRERAAGSSRIASGSRR